MKKMRRQLLSGLCATALVVGMMPGAIWASDAVTYLDMGELKTCESATLVTAEDTVWGADDGAEHWLVAEGDVTIDGRVAVAGDVSLILADGATLVVDGGIDVPFVDVQPDDWYIDVVKYALENGLMTGVNETEFAPDLATTRGMVASVLYRLEGGLEAEDAGFSDVSADAWYADAVNWAANVGVVAGYGDAFGANDAITREQLAAILCNYAAYKGEDVSSGAALDGYSDAASVSDWAGESVEWAVAEGLLSGVTNNELAPQGSATRAQVAAMLQRFNAR